MKVVIRGDAGTGKSTLLRLLQTASQPSANGSSLVRVDPSYTPTRQIQVANLCWHYAGIHPAPWIDLIYIECNADSQDVVKVEIWDVVDRAIPSTVAVHNDTPLQAFQRVEEQIRRTGSARQTDVLDAKTVDVYKHADGVIFLFHLGKPRSLEYVVRELAEIPADLPVLILGNFADKIYTQEDNDFLLRRFKAIRMNGTRPSPSHSTYPPDEQSSQHQMHFIAGSLTEPRCPSNPPIGIIPAILKYFELPFLHVQRKELLKRLKINTEQIDKTESEWCRMIDSVPMSLQSDALLSNSMYEIREPEMARVSSTNVCHDLHSGPMLMNENFTTETLTLSSGKIWNDANSPPGPVIGPTPIPTMNTQQPNW